MAELIDNQHRRFCVRGVIRTEGRVLNAGRRVETAAVLRVLLRPYNLGGWVVETVDIELAAHDAVIELVSKSESRMGIFNQRPIDSSVTTTRPPRMTIRTPSPTDAE